MAKFAEKTLAKQAKIEKNSELFKKAVTPEAMVALPVELRKQKILEILSPKKKKASERAMNTKEVKDLDKLMNAGMFGIVFERLFAKWKKEDPDARNDIKLGAKLIGSLSKIAKQEAKRFDKITAEVLAYEEEESRKAVETPNQTTG